MDEALGAVKGERTPERLGYRSGYYGRTLITGRQAGRPPDGRGGAELLTRGGAHPDVAVRAQSHRATAGGEDGRSTSHEDDAQCRSDGGRRAVDGDAASRPQRHPETDRIAERHAPEAGRDSPHDIQPAGRGKRWMSSFRRCASIVRPVSTHLSSNLKCACVQLNRQIG